MLPETLEIQGFKSFSHPVKINMDDNLPGLYLIVGDNQVDTSLEGNGAGKSTILDAISWVLFDKTYKGLRASNIKPWNDPLPTIVSFSYKDTQSKKIKVTRTQSPKKLLLSIDGSESQVDQATLEKFIGLDINTFHNSIILPQKPEMFFDLKPTAKSELFSELLDLDVWIRRSERSRDDAKDLTLEVARKKGVLEGATSSLETLQSLDLSADIATWDDNNKESIEKLKVDLVAVEKDHKKLSSELISSVRLTELEQEKKDFEKEYKELKDDEDILKADLTKAKYELQSFKKELSGKVRDRNDIEKLGAFCDHCLQSIDDSHKEKHLSAINEQIEEIEIKVRDEEVNIKEFEETEKEFDEAFSEIDSDISSVEDDIRVEVNTMNDHKNTLASFENTIRMLKRDIDRESSAINPYMEKQKENKKEVRKAKDNIVAISEEISEINADIAVLEFWAKEFKSMRLFLISEVLTQFELEVNSALDELGLVGWMVLFAMDKPNKSGKGITKGFTVEIQAPTSGESVAWESWSGRESQRLRLAGNLGLRNLILSRRGIKSNFMVLDEPTAYLSKQGIDDLLRCLTQKAKDSKSQYWIVDHATHGYGYDGKYLVTKDENGSTVVPQGDFA